MAETKWEFCELILAGYKFDKGRQTWSYNCDLYYHCPDGKYIYLELGTIKKPLPYNPWGKALGILGGFGWELVSVQYGNVVSGGVRVLGWDYEEPTLNRQSRVAYLKRPSISGRATDEPKLVL
jgi:hypothetical protein